MAKGNHVARDKKVQILHSLVEGSSIRSIERMTGIHRDTIMRLGVRVGEFCKDYQDELFRNLNCEYIEVDELWGFIAKKQYRLRLDEVGGEKGDIFTFVAIDPNSKLIPSFLVGKRDLYHTASFMEDLASRLKNRVQISSDGLQAYITAVERAFGSEVDYGQIIKKYTMPIRGELEHKYSLPDVRIVGKLQIAGNPNLDKICTSHVEAQNLTVRMHCRRLTRLTNAYSKKLENFKASIALHFAYYNLIRDHSSIKCTPAMEAGILSSALSIHDLLDIAGEP